MYKKLFFLICFLGLFSVFSVAETEYVMQDQRFLLEGRSKDTSELYFNGQSVPLSEGAFSQTFLFPLDSLREEVHLRAVMNSLDSVEKDIVITGKGSSLKKGSFFTLNLLDHQRVQSPILKLTGVVKNIDRFMVNQLPVSIQKNGSFEIEILLEHQKNEIFISGKAKDGAVVALKRTVIYEPNQKKSYSLYKNIEKHMTESILNSYVRKGWNIEFNKKAPPSVKLLSFSDNSKLMVCSYRKLSIPINAKALQLIQQLNPKSDIGVIWLNRNQSIWEMHYHYDAQSQTYVPFLWIINNREIDPRSASGEESWIKYFLKYPF